MSTDAAVSVAPEVAGELARIIDGRAYGPSSSP